jgi:hypothetical protein
VVLGSVLVMFGGLGMMAVRGMAVRWFLRHRSSPLLVFLNSAGVIPFPDKPFPVVLAGESYCRGGVDVDFLADEGV